MSDNLTPHPPPEPGQPDPHAPKNLGRAFRKISEVLRQGAALNGGARKRKKLPEVNRYCDVCKKMFHEEQIIIVDNAGPTPKTCQDCMKELAQGAIAVIAPDGRYSFVWGIGATEVPQKNFVSQSEYDAIVEYAKNNPKPDVPMP